MSYAVEQQSEYLLNSAILSNSERNNGFDIEIKNIITSFQIFEHIEKPYLTAQFIIIDTVNLIQDYDFQGGEKITIEIIQSEEQNEGVLITKEFLIDKIEETTRTDETTDSIIFHCVEYHTFKSSLQNISRSYTGSISSIITKIFNQYMQRNVLSLGNDGVGTIKVIIPNLNPIEAVSWLKKRAVSNVGMPYFLYSVLGTNNLIMRDLGSIFSDPIMNKDVPFIFAPSMTSSLHGIHKYYNILDFKISETEDLQSLIGEGLVGGEYYFYDTMTAVPFRVEHNIEDNFRELSNLNLIGGDNERFVFGPDYKLNDKKISSYQSRSITQMSSSGAYNDGIRNFKSYQQENSSSNHKRKVFAKSMKAFLAKSAIQITVKGREFLTGDENYTIGKVIRILFIDNESSNENTSQILFDTKKSGDYVICAARHTFDNDVYNTTLSCGRLGSLSEEIVL
jgi:hypothetical protein